METTKTKKRVPSRKATSAKKGTSTAKANGVARNKKAAVKKEATAAKTAASKYIFPADVKGDAAKKAFRQTARSKFRAFERKIAEAKKPTEKKKLQTEFNKFIKATYTDPKAAGIETRNS